MFADCSQLAVSEDYIHSVVEQANSKMHSNWARVQLFFELLRQPSQLKSPAAVPHEGQTHQHRHVQLFKPSASKQGALQNASVNRATCRGVCSAAVGCTAFLHGDMGLLESWRECLHAVLQAMLVAPAMRDGCRLCRDVSRPFWNAWTVWRAESGRKQKTLAQADGGR